jgi:nicotinamide riboside kinase
MEIKKVVITGPESTGKTLLAEKLASHFKTVWIPEYAREYVMGLNRKYNFADIEHIAREQLKREQQYLEAANGFLFYDTHLVILKIWFKVVYGRYPAWIDKAIMNSGTHLFLVCNTDIPWTPDPVRENGGEMREVLRDMYIKEIISSGFAWKMVSGKSEKRTVSALDAINLFFKENTIGTEK